MTWIHCLGGRALLTMSCRSVSSRDLADCLHQLTRIFKIRVIGPLLEEPLYALGVCLADAVVGEDPISELDVIKCSVCEPEP